jgi:two-component system, OmpR family, phosphate regulon sensor histidine kinase PhoR
VFRSLRFRLFLAHSLAILATLLVLTLVAAHQQRRWLLERNAEALERVARLIARELEVDPRARSGDWATPAATLATAVGARVTLIDSTGRVLGDSAVPRERLAQMENHAGRPEVRGAMAARASHAVRHSASVGIDFLYVAIPARIRDLAVVRVAEPLTTLSRLNTSLVQVSAAAAAGTWVLGLALVLWITGRHATRIRDLEEVAQRLGAGDRIRAPERPPDELGHLGRALNDMAQELRERLEALQVERDTRERILAHMTDGVALLDNAGRVLHMNHSLAAMLGAPRPAPDGTAFQEYARIPELSELLQDARRSVVSVEAEIRAWTPDQRLLRATATPLGSGPESALLLVINDQTEAERLDRMRQDFVANVSHELRTPLTSMRGYTETLASGGLDDLEHRDQFVQIIRDQTVRLQALVEDLLSLADLERPGLRLRIESLDLREVLRAQAAASRARAQASGLALEVEPGDPIQVRADRARLEQVVANLLDNAIKYTDRGEIRLRAGVDRGVVWCEVADTGAGIPLDDQPRIFERFYRVDKARSREKGGTGLGLSIVKHIVVLHGGRITVDSEPGFGSRFRFEIPLT